MLETSWGIDLPLNELFLEPIAGNLTEILKHQGSNSTNEYMKSRKGERESTKRDEIKQVRAHLASAS